MNLEGITLYTISEYLKQKIIGSRIYKIGMPTGQTVCFSLKRQHDSIHLIIYVNGSSPAVWLSDEVPDNPPEPPSFCMLLRKHLEGGKITHIRQIGLDRVIEMEVSLLGRNSQIVIKKIILELTGKNANLIFAEDGKIIDSVKHVSPIMNSVRIIQPGYDYFPPPPQAGLNILTTSPEKIVAALPDEVNKNLWRVLVSRTTGIGEASAQQLFALANIPFSATYLTPMDRNHLTEAIAFIQASVNIAVNSMVNNLSDNTLEEKKRTAPLFTGIISKANRCQTVFPYPVKYIPEGCRTAQFTCINDALCYAFQLKPAESPEKEILKKTVSAEIRKAEKKISMLQKELSQANDADSQREIADSLMASLYKIQKGTDACTIPNIYNGEPLHVALSPVLSPAENVQKYYKKYNKLKRGREELTFQLSETQESLGYLESVEESLQIASTRLEIEEIKEELQKEGILRVPRHKARSTVKSSPIRIDYSKNTIIFIGKNNRQNDEVTFKIGSAQDLWLHTQNIAGSHVIIKTELPEPEPEALQAALQLAAYFSKARGGSQIPVDCVPRRFVKNISGSKPGFVIFTNQKTFYVTPDETFISKLLTTIKPLPPK